MVHQSEIARETAPALLVEPERRREVSSTAFKLFLRVAERWGLDGAQQMALLGDVPRSTFQRWKSRIERGEPIELTRDQLERVSLCLGIEKGLKLVFVDADAQLRWLKSINHDVPFHGEAPLQRMTDGGIVGLHATRKYLDAWRGIR